MKKAQSKFIVVFLIVIVLVLGGLLFYNQGKSSVTGNVIQENNQYQNPPEVPKKIYASVEDLDVKLSWVQLSNVIYSSSGEVPDECLNGKNVGYIWIDIQLKNMQDKTESFYSCTSDLIEGEQPPTQRGSWNLGMQTGYHTDGEVAFGQTLKNPHSVKVCCSPDMEDGYEICKRFSLESYC